MPITNFAKRLLNPVVNFGQIRRGLMRYPWFVGEWRAYARRPHAEPLKLSDAYPQLHDATVVTPFDAHYLYLNNWAMRRIARQRPARHIDIGSQTMFASLLGAVTPVTFVDYRPLQVSLAGLACLAGDILRLPFADGSIESLSCLHVAEHIGLGRYGDPLNPQGTFQSAQELQRVLKPGGHLYFGLPVGQPRVCFNAHRIHATQTIAEYFSGLELVELSGVHDDRRFVERVGHDEFKASKYACGMFWFRKV